MISIANETAAAFLRRDLLRHLAEIMQIELNIPPFPTQSFADAATPTVVVLVWEGPWGVGAFLSQQNDRFTTESLDYLRARAGRFSLSSVDEDVFAAESVAKLLGAATPRCYPSLAYTSSVAAPNAYHQCRRLTGSDRDLFVRFPHEREGEAPSPSELFEAMVVNETAEIFGVEESGELSGFLSCNHDIDNIWDVDFINVREDRRDRGIGEQLASTYARERLARGGIAYYSSPANRASERVAEKAGFTRCRTLFHAELDTKQ